MRYRHIPAFGEFAFQLGKQAMSKKINKMLCDLVTSASRKIQQRQAQGPEEQLNVQILLWPSVHPQNQAEEIFLQQRLYHVTSCLKPKSK